MERLETWDGIHAEAAEAARRWNTPDGRPPPMLPMIDLGAWQGDPPARRSLWGDMLPLLQTTMLTGRGGIGKSLFEQALLTHVALGLPFLGQETTQRNTLYVTCEDDADELWRRQAAICGAMGVPIAAVMGKLFLCSLTGQRATALATFNESGQIKPTARWHEVEATCQANAVGLYAFETRPTRWPAT